MEWNFCNSSRTWTKQNKAKTKNLNCQSFEYFKDIMDILKAEIAKKRKLLEDKNLVVRIFR